MRATVANKIRVLIDCGWILKPRGLGRYVKELLNAVCECEVSGLEISALVPHGAQNIAKECGVKRIYVAPSLAIPLWEQILVPWVAMKTGVDVVHCPGNTKGLALDALGIRHVVTLHDVMFIDNKTHGLYQLFGNLYRREIVKRMFSKRLHLITVSNASRAQIKEKFGVNASVIYESVELLKEQLMIDGAYAEDNGHTGGPYFVHVGGEAPHKNSKLVVEAFRRADIKGFRLLLLGVSKDSAFAKEHADRTVIVPGWVSDARVATYVSRAHAMVFPSLREGYGLPIVEAFAMGCPVITSNIAPMNEIAGDAALLVNPSSVVEISDALHAVATNDSLRKKLTQAGRERLGVFSAKIMREKTIEIYRQAMLR